MLSVINKLIMLSVIYAWVSFMPSVDYADCCLCWVPFMLSVANKLIMLSVIMMNVVMLSVIAPIY